MNPARILPSPTASPRVATALVAALVLGSLTLGTTARPVAAQGPPSPVKVAPVEKRTVEDRVLVTGDLRAVRRSALAAQEAGLVVELAVLEGEKVEAGAVIAVLDPTRLTEERASLVAMRDATVAEKDQRTAELEMAERDVTSLEELAQKGVTNPKEIADARSAVKIARAQLARTAATHAEFEARLRLIDRRIADLTIRAPYAGTVVARHIELGEWITPGNPTVELVSSGAVEAWLNVPENYRAAMVAAATRREAIEVRIEALGETLTGVPRLVPSVHPSSRNFPVVVTLEDPAGLLAPGMGATAHVPTGRGGEHLLVHKDALLSGQTGPFIYVAMKLAPNEPEKALPMNVRPLFPTGDFFAVEAAGLQPGAPAIVEGNERLFPTQAVAPTPMTPKKKPSPTGDPRGTDRAQGGAPE